MLSSTSPVQWVPVARLLRPQGRKGELLADPLSDLPDILAPGREFALVPSGQTSPQSAPATARIESAWSPTGKNAGRIVLKLAGCDSISQAETLAGKELLLRSTDLPALDPDTFFVADLLGCDLYDGASRAGTIVDVQFATSPDGRTRLEDAAPLLAIDLAHPESPTTTSEPGPELGSEPGSEPVPASEPFLVPFVRAWLDSVDLPGRRVVMHLPLGLLGESRD
jgi:16S rRNA processing protein RimM